MAVLARLLQLDATALPDWMRGGTLPYWMRAGTAVLIGLGLGTLGGLLPWKISLVLLAGVAAIPVLLLGLLRLDLGIMLMVLIGFLTEFIRKFADVPVGLALDGLIVVFAIAMLSGLARSKDLTLFKHPISIMVMVWMYYCFLQFFNPSAVSQKAWAYTVRSLAGLLFLYFIALYAFNTLPKIKQFFKWMLFLGLISALYGLNQRFNGFLDAEMVWLTADEKRFQLIVQWGIYRVFSFFSEPTTCGIVMAYMTCMCVVFAFGPYATWKRVACGLMVVPFVATIVFAGSRTPVALVPAGLFFFVLLAPRPSVLLISFGLVLFGALFMARSSSNPIIYRIQTTFRPTQDASMQVRLESQAAIQPFLQQNPLGAGLGSTGVWGRRFASGFWLAHFEHDSGLVRIAVEAGYIGLIIYLVLLFVIMYTGIRQYFRVRDPVVKNLTLAIMVVMFTLLLASYPQEAIPMLPTSLMFYVLLACLVNLGRIDERLREDARSAAGSSGDLTRVA